MLDQYSKDVLVRREILTYLTCLILKCLYNRFGSLDYITFITQFMEQVLLGKEQVMVAEDVLASKLQYAYRIISD